VSGGKQYVKIRPQAIFSFLFLVFFIVFVYEAQEWRLQARRYPWVIGIPMVVLAFIQLVLDLRGVERKQGSDAPVDFQFAQTTLEPAVARNRAITMFAWFFGFFLAIILLGFDITIPLTIFSYLKMQSRERWAISIILTSAGGFLYWGLFVWLLNLPFPDGLIFTWFGY
jgi:hypothetical protein